MRKNRFQSPQSRIFLREPFWVTPKGWTRNLDLLSDLLSVKEIEQVLFPHLEYHSRRQGLLGLDFKRRSERISPEVWEYVDLEELILLRDSLPELGKLGA